MWKCEDENSIVRFKGFSMEDDNWSSRRTCFFPFNFGELDHAWSVDEIYKSVHENEF